MEMISRSGVRSVTVAKLADEIGVVASGIYRHFGGKDEILDAVLELVSDRLLQNVEAVCRESDDALVRLRELLMRHAQLVRSEVPIPRIIFSEEIFSGSKPRRRRVYRLLQEYLGAIAEIIAGGQEAGQIRREFSPDTLALMLLGLVQPAAILWVMSEGEFDIAGHVDGAWEIFVEVLTTHQKAESKKQKAESRKLISEDNTE